MPKDIIWDIETYKNCFSCVFADTEERKLYSYEISDRKDERDLFFSHLRSIYKNGDRLVGFNSIGFDYPVLHWILENQDCSVEDIYEKAQEIIKADRFQSTIPEWKMYIPQIDLFLIHHFDNKARQTSLKALEFNMLSDNIEDLPYSPHKTLTSDEIDYLVEYNKHDVKETHKFYEKSLGAIQFREKLSKQYGWNVLNFNDTKIGKQFLIEKLEKNAPGCCYVKEGKRKKPRQTPREYIDIKDVIFDYIEFNRPEFNAILEWMTSKRITETKGVFSNLEEDGLGSVLDYARMTTKSKKVNTQEEIDNFKMHHPCGWVEERELKSGKTSTYFNWNISEKLNVMVEGNKFVYGTGGVHMSTTPGLYQSDEDHVIVTADVASLYPNISIKNRAYPEHLGEFFCDIYEQVYKERKKYPKGSDENEMMKLALNGTYGASNDKYSPFYDPKFTMTITINGQLLMSMYLDMLLTELDYCKILLANSDGAEFIIPREDLEKFNNITERWQDITHLEMEVGYYSKIAIRDVNNYIGVSE